MDELVAAQQLLGRSLGKARAGEDKELSGRVRDAGEALAHMLGSALKMTRIHASDNKAFDMPVAEVVKALAVLNGLIGAVHLVSVDEQVFLNDVGLRAEGRPSIRELGAELRKHNVGGVTFHAPLDDRQVRALAAAFAGPPQEPMPRTAVRHRLEQAGITSVELHGVYRFRTNAEKASHSQRATGPEAPRQSGLYSGSASSAALQPPRHVAAPLSNELVPDAGDASFEPAALAATASGAHPHATAVAEPAAAAVNPAFAMLDQLGALAAGAWGALATGRTFSPLPLRRAIAELLEIGADSTALWDAWVTGPTRTNHAVSVTVHALLVGHAAGLPLAVLQDLGVAALVHDIGYAALVGTPRAAGAEGLARHPGEGARLLLQQRGFSQAKVRRLRAVLDHHRPWSSEHRPSVLGCILRLAEDYLGFLRVAGTQTTAVHVVGAMAHNTGGLYHPVLLQLFIDALGQFPPGVLLGLDDGRTVRSVSPVLGPESFASPLVRDVDPQTRSATGPQRPLGSAKVTTVWPG